MAQEAMLLFHGRNRIRYGYARWGYTRGGGKTWHGGADVEGLDDTTIRMPGYGLGQSRCAICGTVVTARKVAQNTGNPTWEWGWYICVKLDANQTPDAVNYLYFCHNAKNLVAVGQPVKTGDVLAVMGNTGNAALASPPYAHCHFEVRATAMGKGLDPTQYMGFENAVGTYGVAEQEEIEMVPPLSNENVTMQIGPASPGDRALLKQQAQGLGLGYREGAANTNGGALVYIGPASGGDQRIVLTQAAKLGLAYCVYVPESQAPAEPAKPAQGELEALRAQLEVAQAENTALQESLSGMTAQRDAALQQAEAATQRAENAEAKIKAACAALEGACA